MNPPHRHRARGLRLARLVLNEARPTLALAFPIMSGMVSQMLLGLADTVMVGRVGVTPLAAAAFVTILFHLPLVFGIGLLSSVAVLAAQAFGAREHARAGEMLRHGLLLSAGAGFVIAGLLCALRPALGLFGQPAEVVAASGNYLWLVSASLFPLMVTHTAKQYSESLNRPWVPTCIMLGGVALNILLNWILIYGRLGAPALGLDGAGWATLLARIAMGAAMLLWVIHAPCLRKWQPRRWAQPLYLATLRRLWELGWPVAVQHLCEVSAFALCGLMIGSIGADALAAHQIAINCAATTFMFPLGIGMAVAIRVGHAWGAGRLGRVRRIAGAGLAMAMAVMGLFGLVFLFWGRPLSSLFVASPDVIRIATQLLVVAAVFQIMDGIQIVSISALRGMTDVRVPMAIALLSYWVVAVPLAYLLAFVVKQGPVGIWAGVATGLAGAAFALTWRLHRMSRTLSVER